VDGPHHPPRISGGGGTSEGYLLLSPPWTRCSGCSGLADLRTFFEPIKNRPPPKTNGRCSPPGRGSRGPAGARAVRRGHRAVRQGRQHHQARQEGGGHPAPSHSRKCCYSGRPQNADPTNPFGEGAGKERGPTSPPFPPNIGEAQFWTVKMFSGSETNLSTHISSQHKYARLPGSIFVRLFLALCDACRPRRFALYATTVIAMHH